MQNQTDYADLVVGKVEPSAEFRPTAYYDADGDCIEFLASPESFYAQRIDDLVTIYFRQGTEEIIGALFKGVSKHLARLSDNLPGFQIEIQDGKVKLSLLLQVNLWSLPSPHAQVCSRKYRKLIEMAEEANAEADLCPA